MLVLDSHAHCGLSLPWQNIHSLWKEGDIDGGVLFSPVEEIYDRYDFTFVDSDYYRRSRKTVHDYLAKLTADNKNIYAHWFVWNDFELPRENFVGIKWHRHSNEPFYKYDAEECEKFIQHICDRKLPVIIEDEFQHTLDLVKRINGRTVIIIPHFGGLNGGYERLKRSGLFEDPTIYVDTALAGVYEIADFAADYGHERILYGSDYPFGDPSHERYKVEKVFTGKAREKVLAENLLQLLGKG